MNFLKKKKMVKPSNNIGIKIKRNYDEKVNGGEKNEIQNKV